MTAQTTIKMFGADWCRDCRRAKALFDSRNVMYTYIDLAEDEAAARVARDISGRMNIPVIVYPDGSFQVEPSNTDMITKLTELNIGNADG